MKLSPVTEYWLNVSFLFVLPLPISQLRDSRNSKSLSLDFEEHEITLQDTKSVFPFSLFDIPPIKYDRGFQDHEIRSRPRLSRLTGFIGF